MNYKSLFFLVVFSLTLISGVFAQKKVSILGDSYSTFYGHVSPAANLCWYGVPGEKKENDVTKVEETWWYRFIHEHGFQLERNNSYSGSTVCHTGYEKADYSDRSFITRIHNLGTPDIILVLAVPMTVGQVLPLAHTNMMAGRKPICIASVLPFAICLHLSSSSILRPGFIILPILNYPKR